MKLLKWELLEIDDNNNQETSNIEVNKEKKNKILVSLWLTGAIALALCLNLQGNKNTQIVGNLSQDKVDKTENKVEITKNKDRTPTKDKILNKKDPNNQSPDYDVFVPVNEINTITY